MDIFDNNTFIIYCSIVVSMCNDSCLMEFVVVLVDSVLCLPYSFANKVFCGNCLGCAWGIQIIIIREVIQASQQIGVKADMF